MNIEFIHPHIHQTIRDLKSLLLEKNNVFLLQSNHVNEYHAPVGIRTRVAGSKGRNDWPDYTTGAILSSPERIRTAVAGSKGQHVNHYTTGLSGANVTEGIVVNIYSILDVLMSY